MTKTTLNSAIRSGKFTSRQLLAQFGKTFTKLNDAGKIAWKRVARKGQKGYFVATLA